MKHSIFLLAILFISFATLSAQEITVENPPFSVRNHGCAEIERIVLTDTATVLYFKAYSDPKLWIKFASDTYIRANGQKYKVIRADGIQLDAEIFAETGLTPFSMTFPPIAPDTRQIDFIEGDCENCFKTWGIELKSDTITNRIRLPEALTAFKADRTDQTPLPAPVFKDADAIVKGQITGYVPEMFGDMKIYVNNPFTGIQEEYDMVTKKDGTFSVSVPLVCSMEVLFRISGLINKYILLSPGKETFLYFDLQQKYRAEGRNRKDKCPPSKWMFFGGANADINEQLLETVNDYVQKRSDFQKMIVEIAGMSPEEYKNYCLDNMNQSIAGLEALNLSQKVRELAEINIQLTVFSKLLMGDYYLSIAYKQAHNIQDRDDAPDYKKPVFDIHYFDFLNRFPVNNPKVFYYNSYAFTINECKFIKNSLDTTNTRTFFIADCIPALMSLVKMPPEDIAIAKEIQEKFPKNNDQQTGGELSPEMQSMIEKSTAFFNKYADDLKFLFAEEDLKDNIALLEKLSGTDKGPAFDLINLQTYSKKLEESTPLTYELDCIDRLGNPFYSSWFAKRNKQLLDRIEANKHKKGYNVYDTPETEDDQLFHELMKPFEGKVVLVDFWATWCGPCRQAMKQLEPAKVSYQGKDVVFVYLTDETSPLAAWQNMIPDIHGEHYRLTNKQFDYLKKKFGVRGIPSYLILNKKGDQVYFRVAFEGVDAIKRIIDKELK